MIDYNDDMDQNWMRRLENQRAEDRKSQARADQVERIVITLLWAGGLIVLLAAAYWLGTMKRGQATSLMIVIPAASPSPSPTPEPEAESTFGTPQGASIIASTEPPTLRTVQNHPPSSRTVKTVPRSFRALAIRQAGRCKVPVSLALTLVSRESSWNPLAVSSAGAVGLAQVRPYHSGPLLDVRDPETNLSLGFCLLRRHFDRLKGWHLSDSRAWTMALEAYHGGQYRTRTAAITRRYAKDIILGSAQ